MSTSTRRAVPTGVIIKRAVSLVLMSVVTLAILLPIIVMFFSAFKPEGEINTFPPTLVPETWTLDNFRVVMDSLPMGRLMLNSVVFAGGVALIAVLFDSMAAYALARIDFTGRKTLLIVIIAGLMIPFQATLVPLYGLVSDLGWVNTFFALIVPRAADAFGIFFLRQFFLALPRDLDNAARIDGASEWRVFVSVVAPNAAPAILTLGVFHFINNWNDLLWPLVLTTSRDMGTVTSGLTLLTGPSGIIPPGVMMAGSLISIAPLVVAYIFVQRRFIESIATTGLK